MTGNGNRSETFRKVAILENPIPILRRFRQNKTKGYLKE